MKGNNLSDMVFWYKANNDIESYVLGDRKLWYTHYKYYRTDKEMEDIKQDQGGVCQTSGSKKDKRITHIYKTLVDGTKY